MKNIKNYLSLFIASLGVATLLKSVYCLILTFGRITNPLDGEFWKLYTNFFQSHAMLFFIILGIAFIVLVILSRSKHRGQIR